MKKFGLIIGAITILAIIGGALLLPKKNELETSAQIISNPPSVLEYYWGDGCPHCAKVQEFLDGWDKKDEVKIEKFETWYNNDNATKMQSVVDYCKIPRNTAGVPLLFTTEGKCIIGDTPIIDYFKSLFSE